MLRVWVLQFTSYFATVVSPEQVTQHLCLHSPIKIHIYIYIFGCAGSLMLHGFFSSCGERGPLSSCARASHCSGFSCCGAQA